jgi:U3 small nucleolar RNA-associated protein 15
MNDDPHFILSGGYDHVMKIWDTRSNTCILSMNHDLPIESVLYLPGGGIVCSAGGNRIKMWDVRGGLIHTIAPHSKTITDMCIDSTQSYLLSASIDRQVKVTSLVNYKVEQTLNYCAPILSLAVSKDNSQIAVGMTSGQIAIRKRIVKKEMVTTKKDIVAGTRSYFMRGTEGEKDDV